MSFLDSNILFVDRNQRFEALFEIPSPTCYCVKLFLHLMQCFSVLLFVSSKQTHCFTRQMAEMTENRFRPAKTFEEEEKCVASAIPKSTQYKTNGRLEVLENSRVRLPKVATLEPGGLFKNYDLHKVHSFDVPLLEMDG